MQQYLKKIKKRLQTINPYKVILFGSASRGKTDLDSDIDIIVVLNSEKIPQDYEEKMKNKSYVRKIIRKLSQKIPIDLLVYTKKEFEIIMNNKNSFFEEVDSEGKVLYGQHT